MKKISYKAYRFPSEFIQHAIWLYIRFTLSFSDVEDLLAERGIMVSYETVRRWATISGRWSQRTCANAGRSHIRLVGVDGQSGLRGVISRCVRTRDISAG
jgi:putative transposase